MKPKVYLVGAGPGDPELLTLKAARILASATVVLVDDLVNHDVLKHCSSNARILPVGKRGGCKSTPQAFIEKLMIRQARRGDIVVRLKGGDPFIFGRGGEEMQALNQAGVEVEIVNGITSGLAASAALQAPLTHRDHAHGVVFVTGHPKSGDLGTDWAALAHTAAQAKLSLVIYMGLSNIHHIEQGLLQGLPGHTPAAIVEGVTTNGERKVLTQLGDLAACAAREASKSPSIVLVGEVFAAAVAESSHVTDQSETTHRPDRQTARLG